jgi:outer membrane biosynthesis protein TonB
MRRTSSSEFVAWNIKFKRDLNKRDPIIYYLANLTAEVRRVWVKHKKKPKLEDVLLDFTLEQLTDEEGPPTEEEVATRIAVSKAYWGAIIGAAKPPPGKLPKPADAPKLLATPPEAPAPPAAPTKRPKVAPSRKSNPKQ